MNLPELSVGDELIVREIRRGGHTDSVATVTKLGRKWAYAAASTGWREIKFDMTTGYEDGRGHASFRRVLTPEMDAAEKRIQSAHDELRGLGVRFDSHSVKDVPVETIEAIVQIMRDAKGIN